LILIPLVLGVLIVAVSVLLRVLIIITTVRTKARLGGLTVWSIGPRTVRPGNRRSAMARVVLHVRVEMLWPAIALNGWGDRTVPMRRSRASKAGASVASKLRMGALRIG
jgi:hypothetical protein